MSTQHLFLILLFITVPVSITRRQLDLTFGKRLKGDKLAMKIDLRIPAKLVRSTSITKTYNTKGEITFIRILDNHIKGSGAQLIVKNGGVGTKFVTFYLKSRKAGKLKFTIEIYHLIKKGSVNELAEVPNISSVPNTPDISNLPDVPNVSDEENGESE